MPPANDPGTMVDYMRKRCDDRKWYVLARRTKATMARIQAGHDRPVAFFTLKQFQQEKDRARALGYQVW